MNNPMTRFDADGHWGCQGSQEGFCSPAAQDGLRNGMTPSEALDAAHADKQQIGQDPTLPTAQARPLLYKADIADLKHGAIQIAVLFGTEGLGEIAEVGSALFRGLELSTKLSEEGVIGAEKVAKITEEADKFYPSKIGKIEEHHDMPQALGGPRSGPKTAIPASYHQLITNMTRTLTKNYTDFSAGAGAIMDKVYSYFPIHW